jgi:hypothetical protein
MCHSTLAAALLATPFAHNLLPLVAHLLPTLQQLGQLLEQFPRQPLTPQAMSDFEKALDQQTCALARATLEWLLNRLEPADPQASPRRLACEGNLYRRRDKHPNTLATLFGPVRLQRLLYEPLEPGERCLHPLERRLGVVAGCATPALAERAGWWLAQQPQRAVLTILRRDHGVGWSQATLRKVVASLRDGLEPQRPQAQQQRLLGWLRRAQEGRGPHRPVLAVGRDGIHVPLRQQGYREGATATLSVLDRRGKRLGTVYLGRMPEEGQATLSAQLTALVTDVLRAWDGPVPRLAYVTDGGWHPEDYFRRVLRPLADPRQPKRQLGWERILDFYHATEYLTKLATALFGEGYRAYGWARKMRRWLKGSQGLSGVLHSAGYHRGQRRLSGARAKAYQKAYDYLRKRRRFMEYTRYRRLGLPLGSGVTEAACKIVFTQRLKQSGMRWEIASGQVVVDLRVLLLSGVWADVQAAHLKAQETLLPHDPADLGPKSRRKTA